MKFFRKETINVPRDEETETVDTYMVRYMFDFFRNVCINVILGDDMIPGLKEQSRVSGLHNHPWDYFTLVLWGGYYETLVIDGEQVTKKRRPGWFAFRKYNEYHSLRPINKKAITLFIRFKRRQFCTYYMVDDKPISEVRYWLKQGYSKEYYRKRIEEDKLS